MPESPKRDWLDAVTFPLLFMWMFGGYLLFLKGPAVNGQQQAFRVAVFAVGMVGTIVVGILKAARDRRPGR